MKKIRMETVLSILLLAGLCLLFSRESHQTAGKAVTGEKQAEAAGTVVVDAGHGGSDPGMIGMGGLEEKGINLSISLFLRDTLEKSG